MKNREMGCLWVRKVVHTICVLLCFSLASPVIGPPDHAYAKSKKEEEKERARKKKEKEERERQEEKERARKKQEKEERERQEEKERARRKAEKEERERQEERERARKKAEEEARELAEAKARAAEKKAREAADALAARNKPAPATSDCGTDVGQSWNGTMLICRSREKAAEAFAKDNIYDAAVISQKIYGDAREYSSVNGWSLLSLQNGDSGCFTKADGRDNITGFHAIALVKGGTIMVAFEGTNVGDMGDISTDWDHFHGKEPEQYQQAEKFLTTILENFPNYDIILAGHSLGGSLAEHLAVKIQKWDSPTFVITFNSAGLNTDEANLIPSAGLDASNVWNYYTVDQLSKPDTVYSYGTRHFGTGHPLKINVPMWEGQNNGLQWKKYRHSIDTVVPACKEQCKE